MSLRGATPEDHRIRAWFAGLIPEDGHGPMRSRRQRCAMGPPPGMTERVEPVLAGAIAGERFSLVFQSVECGHRPGFAAGVGRLESQVHDGWGKRVRVGPAQVDTKLDSLKAPDPALPG